MPAARGFIQPRNSPICRAKPYFLPVQSDTGNSIACQTVRLGIGDEIPGFDIVLCRPLTCAKPDFVLISNDNTNVRQVALPPNLIKDRDICGQGFPCLFLSIISASSFIRAKPDQLLTDRNATDIIAQKCLRVFLIIPHAFDLLCLCMRLPSIRIIRQAIEGCNTAVRRDP